MATLFNKYEVIEKIGQGGTSNVYLAKDISSEEKLAIKVVDKTKGEKFDFLAEPNILKKLDNPALPKILDIKYDEKNIYIIEDYIEGVSLDKKLKQVGKFDESIVVDWAKQLCLVLIYLHNQKPNPIIYRDMKPGNIIITPDNEVKLIDFGIAREFKTTSTTDTMYIGTRGYAAPEQYGGSQSDVRTDIYSLGVTMYHLLTGKSPNEVSYDFRPLRTVDSRLSEEIEYIVNKCVQNRPDERYQNVHELLYDLENIKPLILDNKKKKEKSKSLNLFKVSLIFVFLGMSVLGVSFIKNGVLQETGSTSSTNYNVEKTVDINTSTNEDEIKSSDKDSENKDDSETKSSGNNETKSNDNNETYSKSKTANKNTSSYKSKDNYEEKNNSEEYYDEEDYYDEEEYDEEEYYDDDPYYDEGYDEEYDGEYDEEYDDNTNNSGENNSNNNQIYEVPIDENLHTLLK